MANYFGTGNAYPASDFGFGYGGDGGVAYSTPLVSAVPNPPAPQGDGFFGLGQGSVLNTVADVAPSAQGYIRENLTTVTTVQDVPIALTNTLVKKYVAPTVNVGQYAYDETIAPQASYSKVSFLYLLGAALAILGLLAALLLAFFLLRSDPHKSILWHLILFGIGLAIALFCAWVLFDSRSKINNGQEPNQTMVLTALLLSILLACALLAAAIYLFMYRPFVYSHLAGNNGTQAALAANGFAAPNQSLWQRARSLLGWLPLAVLAGGIGLAIMGIGLWKMNKFQEQVGRWILGALLLAAIIASLAALCYLHKAHAMYANAPLGSMNSGLTSGLSVLLWIGVGLLFLNLVWNVFKMRSGHFLFGVLLIIFLFVLACVLGLTLRDLRNRHFGIIENAGAGSTAASQSSKCATLLDSVHEADIVSFCPNKYLPQGEFCTKAWMASHWETDGSPRFLNPACCAQISSFFLWPLYVAGAFCLILFFLTLAAIAANLFLADKSEYLEFTDRKFSLGEIIFAALAALAILAFLIYFIFFRKAFVPPRQNPNNSAVRDSNGMRGISAQAGQAFPTDADFELVNLKKIYGGSVPQETWIPWALKSADPLRSLRELGLTSFITSAENAVADSASSLGAGVKNLFARSSAAAEAGLSSAAGSVANAASGVGQGISDAVASVYSAVTPTANAAALAQPINNLAGSDLYANAAAANAGADVGLIAIPPRPIPLADSGVIANVQLSAADGTSVEQVITTTQAAAATTSDSAQAAATDSSSQSSSASDVLLAAPSVTTVTLSPTGDSQVGTQSVVTAVPLNAALSNTTVLINQPIGTFSTVPTPVITQDPAALLASSATTLLDNSTMVSVVSPATQQTIVVNSIRPNSNAYGHPIWTNSTVFQMGTQNNVMTVILNDQLCKNFNYCGFRFGVLAVNGRLADFPFGTPGMAHDSTRLVYFNDTSSFNDFQAFCGTPDQLNAIFSQLRVTPVDVSAPITLLFKGEQLNLADLDANCLRKGEIAADVALSASGYTDRNLTNFLIKGYENDRSCYYNNTCVSDIRCFENPQMIVCKKGFVFYPNDGIVTVTVPLLVRDAQGNLVLYDENSLRVNSYYIYNGQKFFLKEARLDGGRLVFNVPRPLNGNVDVHLSLYDQAGHYLPVTQTYVVPPYTNPTFLAQDLQLLTRNGQGCAGDANRDACFAAQTLGYNTVDVQTIDSVSRRYLGSVPVKLYSGLDGSRFVGLKTSGANGMAIFPNVAYDYYTAQFEGNELYLPARAGFSLQKPEDGHPVLHLTPRSTQQPGVIEEFVSNPALGADRDLCMSIVSHQNRECKVNSLNKYCGYAQYTQDVQLGQEGYERIRINNFTASHYLTYFCNSSPYSGTCPALQNSFGYQDTPINPLQPVAPRRLSFDWAKVRKLDGAYNFRTISCFNGWGFNTLRSYRVDTAEEPNALLCAQFYPPNTFWSLNNLLAYNRA